MTTVKYRVGPAGSGALRAGQGALDVPRWPAAGIADADPPRPPRSMTDADDPFDLQRFASAQAPVWDRVRAELVAGAKRSHWMWFVFPQLVHLGRSETARLYGIRSRGEAVAYARHPLLGARLREACALVQVLPAGAVPGAFGPVDALKLRSCLTLFAAVVADDALFGQVLERHFGGTRCELTRSNLPPA